MKILRLLTPLLALATLMPFLAGCGDSGGPDKKVEETRVNTALEMRKLFDKTGGDYTKLDAADKASMDKLAGGEEQAKAVFADMKKGPSGGVSAGPGSGQ